MKNKTKIFLYRSCLSFVPFLENFCFLLSSHNYSNIRFAIILTIIMEDLLCRGSRIISYLPIYCLLMKCRMLFIVGFDRNVTIKVDFMEIVLIPVLIYISVLTQFMAHWYLFGKIPIIFINVIFINEINKFRSKRILRGKLSYFIVLLLIYTKLLNFWQAWLQRYFPNVFNRKSYALSSQFYHSTKVPDNML